MFWISYHKNFKVLKTIKIVKLNIHGHQIKILVSEKKIINMIMITSIDLSDHSLI